RRRYRRGRGSGGGEGSASLAQPDLPQQGWELRGMVIAFLLAAAAQPSAEALRLGRQLAETGSLAAVLPLVQEKETEELVAAHPELSAAGKDLLRATAQAVYRQGRDRLMQAEAESYARTLPISDLR